MKKCPCCHNPITITPAGNFRTIVYEDGHGVFAYIGHFECLADGVCQNTNTVSLWESLDDEALAERDLLEKDAA